MFDAEPFVIADELPDPSRRKRNSQAERERRNYEMQRSAEELEMYQRRNQYDGGRVIRKTLE
jgi:hypothetical protein